MSGGTIAQFGVLDASGTIVLPTEVTHLYDSTIAYELICISQTNEDGDIDTVVLSREQFLSIQAQLKGH